MSARCPCGNGSWKRIGGEWVCARCGERDGGPYRGVLRAVFDPCRICAKEAKTYEMTDEEIAELTERLWGVPAASVLRALAVEYEDDEATETETP